MWERGVVTANEFSWMTLFQLSCSVIIEQQIAKEGGKLDPRTVLRVWERERTWKSPHKQWQLGIFPEITSVIMGELALVLLHSGGFIGLCHWNESAQIRRKHVKWRDNRQLQIHTKSQICIFWLFRHQNENCLYLFFESPLFYICGKDFSIETVFFSGLLRWL